MIIVYTPQAREDLRGTIALKNIYYFHLILTYEVIFFG